MSVEKHCDNCEHFMYWQEGDTIGDCCRYPQPVKKHPEDSCGEHSFAPPDSKLLETDLDLVPDLSPRTRSLYRKAGLRTIDDLLLVGPHAILNTSNRIDVAAIRELRLALKKLGVRSNVL